MKTYNLLLCAVLFTSSAIKAQQTFMLTPNPVIGVQLEPIRVEGSAMVKNLAATRDTFSWKRTVIRLDNDSICQTQVTDPYLHWFHLVSEKPFWLDPGQEGPMNVTLWDFQEVGCCAIVHMKIKKLDAPIDSIESFYYLRSCQPLAVLDLQKSSIQLFPNPATQFFSLKNAESVSHLALCDASGKMLKQIQANAENRYNITDLPTGAYFLVIQNTEQSILQVLQLQKE